MLILDYRAQPPKGRLAQEQSKGKRGQVSGLLTKPLKLRKARMMLRGNTTLVVYRHEGDETNRGAPMWYVTAIDLPLHEARQSMDAVREALSATPYGHEDDEILGILPHFNSAAAYVGGPRFFSATVETKERIVVDKVERFS